MDANGERERMVLTTDVKRSEIPACREARMGNERLEWWNGERGWIGLQRRYGVLSRSHSGNPIKCGDAGHQYPKCDERWGPNASLRCESCLPANPSSSSERRCIKTPTDRSGASPCSCRTLRTAVLCRDAVCARTTFSAFFRGHVPGAISPMSIDYL